MFGVAFLVAVGGWERPLPRWGRLAFGLACALAAGAALLNLPGKWEAYRERAAERGAFDQFLARQVRWQLGQFSAVLLAGIAGAVSAAVGPRERRDGLALAGEDPVAPPP